MLRSACPPNAFAALLCIVLAIAGCGEDSGAGVESAAEAGASSGGSDVGGGDAGVEQDTATSEDTAKADSTAPVDSGESTPDDGPADTGNDCPGGPGCACTGPAECDAGFCIDSASGKECAATCTDSCKDPTYRCVQTAVGTDIANICVPAFDWLCNPCTKSEQCQKGGLGDAACMSYGAAGAFCGTVCKEDSACPKDYACVAGKNIEGKATKQCARKSADGKGAGGKGTAGKSFGDCPCSELAVNSKLATTCSVEHKNDKGELLGSCKGERVCTESGLTACTAPDLAAEKCDGTDNDCDGKTDEGTCDDNNTCTTDACDPTGDGGKGKCIHNKLTGPCDADGSACTEDDKCIVGVCTPGAAKNCDDGNSCTADSCDPAAGCTQTADDGKGCNADDNDCTIGDKCVGGTCAAGAAKKCTSNDACVVSKCNQASGKCAFKSAPPGAACDDGSKCTTGDGCSKGDCLGTLLKCDDANPCTNDSCAALSGCKYEPNTLPCDDGGKCTSGDTCKAGTCASGPAISCDDGNVCTADTCDPKTGKCKITNLTTLCDDKNACTSGDACGGGFCTGKPIKCDDGNACTNDNCDAKASGGGAGGCTKTANKNPCDDANKCTANDTCTGGSCVGLAKQVTSDCNDGQVCTTDACLPKVGCVHTKNTNKCTDGNPCTVGDTCSGGKCAAGTNTCGCSVDVDCDKSEDGDLCNGTLFCNKSKLPFKCAINPTTVIVCGKGGDTACKTNRCAPKTGKCTLDAVNEAKPCDADGTVCTQGDLCKSGLCTAGKPVNCNDNNICTTDSCDPAKGCKHAANTAACNADNNKCTLLDTCSNNVCVAGKPKNCNDGKVCTADGCDPKTGACTYNSTAPNGKNCNDGSACTTKDACSGGVCKGVGKNCNDNNPCTKDSCTLKAGCSYSDASGSCDDGSACTEADKCGKDSQGKHGCLPGKPKNCNDGNDCTVDSCDAKLGCVKKPAVGKQFPCYGGAKGTDSVGTCHKGKATCGNDGTLGACQGAVVPAKVEACDGKDDTCDGKTDEGCTPIGVKIVHGNVQVRGAGPTYRVRLFGGARGVSGGKASSGSNHVRWSVLAWLKAVVE